MAACRAAVATLVGDNSSASVGCATCDPVVAWSGAVFCGALRKKIRLAKKTNVLKRFRVGSEGQPIPKRWKGISLQGPVSVVHGEEGKFSRVDKPKVVG